MRVGSLFTGIGMFDLGLERAGMRVVWQCEANEYRRKVLALRWPGVPCYPDVRCVAVEDIDPVDVLCGGFPCQDLSLAGKGAGIDGTRSGLWSEFARLVGELRPRYVIVENVPALLHRGAGRVLGDLAAVGYDAEWDCLPAAAFGAPHRGDRLWLVAYPGGDGCRHGERRTLGDEWATRAGARHVGQLGGDQRVHRGRGGVAAQRTLGATRNGEVEVADTLSDGLEGQQQAGAAPWTAFGDGRWWATEPNVGRVVDGCPNRVDRLSALGDSLVPQIAEWIGRRIMACEEERLAA